MWRYLLDLVLPVRCVACRGPDGPLCSVCARHALHTEPSLVPADDRPGGGVPTRCVAAGAYGGALRSALIAYKERGQRALARPLGARLAEAVAVALVASPPGVRLGGTGSIVLVPVPSSDAAIRARRGDHVVALARFAAVTLRERGFDARVESALTMCRTPADSVGLSAAQRRVNVAGAFAAARARTGARSRLPPGGAIVLVDDIVTTGATLAEAYRAARAGGLPVRAAAVVAATPRPGVGVSAVRDRW
ncbi:ComF family protein [Cryptosporangium minutisporangium]|uniref:ComF family protein n=1 Tax=Cryptosporangium minutisporangium TaxID=113569 RepID=A0ABP6T4H9_9ACTN